MKLDDLYPSRWLKATDINAPTLATIKSVVIEEIASDEDKPVLNFCGNLKPLILNRTNCLSIGELYGEDTDDWTGKAVVLFSTKVQFQSRLVDAIRIRAPKLKAVAPAPTQPAPAEPQEAVEPPPAPQAPAASANAVALHTVHESLREVVLEGGYTFSHFQTWAAETGNVPDAHSLPGFDSLATEVCKRLLRAKAGLLKGLAQVKALEETL